MKEQAPLGWAGVDVGKGHHWICLIDEAGTTVWSTKVVNDEATILDAIGGVLARAEEVIWGVDVTGTMSGLLLALLAAHGQRVRYVPGRTVNQMASAYRGEAKTDARDAYVIAETLRHRGDLAEVEVATSLVTELRLLVTHRTDLVGDRVRMVNRLRDVLSGYFPALERSFDYAHSRGALTLLTGYQTPQAIRRAGQSRLRAWLVKRKVRSADQIAAAALVAAKAQQTVVPGQDVAASIVADLATQLLAIGSRISELDTRITTTFRAHPQAEIIESLPGMGPILGAELVAAAGDLGGYANAGRLASAAGLVPVPRDSGRRTGNLHRPMRYSRKLRRVFYLSASAAMVREGPNRDYYLKKRGQGLGHVQALIALARRRVDVLWALLRDNRPFEPTPPMRQPMPRTA
jgi:transposase